MGFSTVSEGDKRACPTSFEITADPFWPELIIAASNATPVATVVLVNSTWTYAGTGYTVAPDAQLALASAACARDH